MMIQRSWQGKKWLKEIKDNKDKNFRDLGDVVKYQKKQVQICFY